MRAAVIHSALRRAQQRPRRLELRAMSEVGSESASSTATDAPVVDSIHSSDIAFKPAESGWGAGKKYINNYDNIFGNKKKETQENGGETGNESL